MEESGAYPGNPFPVPPVPPPLAVITGPTGAGKTEFALRLAREFPVEIVSVDSAQVYRGLDIGAAKPSAEVRAQFPHHLIDIVDPATNYSAGNFVRDAAVAIAEIEARGRIPLLVGGTMLYLRSLTTGIAKLPESSAAVRAQIDADAAQLGWPALHERLAGVDAAAAARIHPNDAQRIQRALEVFTVEGRPISELQKVTRSELTREFRVAALVPQDRVRLHSALADRFDGMMSAGLLDEVRRLFMRGDLSAEHPAIRAVGYRQLWAHLAGSYPLDVAVTRAIAATRQLAKRQMTWLRSMPDIQVFDPYDAQSFVGLRASLIAALRLD